MMKILVCFSMVFDTDSVSPKEWVKTSPDGLETGYIATGVNSYDEAALESALRLKDAGRCAGETLEVTAVIAGQSLKEIVSRSLFAVGVDRVVLLKTDHDLRFSPRFTAHALCGFACGAVYDAVFTGQYNSIGSNGQTGVLLAHLLDIPHVGYVSEVELLGKRFHARCQTKNGYQQAAVKTPAVYSFFNARYPYLRIATLREKLASSGRAIEEMTVPPECGGQPDPAPESLYYEPARRDCHFIIGGSPDEKSAALLELLPHRKEGI